MAGVLNDHVFFWGRSVFSQWHKSSFTLNGADYVTAEQAMMHAKAKLCSDAETADKIMATANARKQKSLGREVRGFDPEVWDREKFRIVCEISLAKFDQNEGLRRKLFQTGTRGIVEASPHDLIWGIGLDEATAKTTPPEDWPGENLLGKALEKAREALAVKYPDEAAKHGDTTQAAPQQQACPFGKIDTTVLELHTGSGYPGKLQSSMDGRSSYRLGEAGGLTQFGANLVMLEPGAKSSLRHWHVQQDEFLIVIEGELVLVLDGGETPLVAGDSAAFKAGVPNGHCVVNRSDRPGKFLVVGTHTPEETAYYSDLDMKVEVKGGNFAFTRKDGSPLDPDMGEKT